MQKEIFKNRPITRSLVLIALASFVQPYFVLGTQYGLSNECMKCSLIEQNFFVILLYLIIPLTIVYIITKHVKLNFILQAIFIASYLTIVSFYKITIPMYDDRVGAWSTFSDDELFNHVFSLSLPSLVALFIAVSVGLTIINKKKGINKISNELLDN